MSASPTVSAEGGKSLISSTHVELEVFGWRTEGSEAVLRCRLVDSSTGTIPARWTDLPRRVVAAPPLGTVASPAAWRLLAERLTRLRAGRPPTRPAWGEKEAADAGPVALATSEQTIVAAAVWESLPPERQPR